MNVPRFTDREIELANFLTGGATTKEIADALGVSVRTVEFHKRNVCRKLHVCTVFQAGCFLARFKEHHKSLSFSAACKTHVERQ